MEYMTEYMIEYITLALYASIEIDFIWNQILWYNPFYCHQRRAKYVFQGTPVKKFFCWYIIQRTQNFKLVYVWGSVLEIIFLFLFCNCYTLLLLITMGEKLNSGKYFALSHSNCEVLPFSHTSYIIYALKMFLKNTHTNLFVFCCIY